MLPWPRSRIAQLSASAALYCSVARASLASASRSDAASKMSAAARQLSTVRLRSSSSPRDAGTPAAAGTAAGVLGGGAASSHLSGSTDLSLQPSEHFRCFHEKRHAVDGELGAATASDGWRSERAVSAMRSTQYATMP